MHIVSGDKLYRSVLFLTDLSSSDLSSLPQAVGVRRSGAMPEDGSHEDNLPIVVSSLPSPRADEENL